MSGGELRRAIRSLLGTPGFSAVVILTTALGIGTATAVFSLVYAILLRPFPYQDPDGLVRVQSRNTVMGDALRGVSLLDLEDYRRQSRTIEDIGAFTAFEVQIVEGGSSEVATITQANPAAINILHVPPSVGRLLRPDEDVRGGDVHKALISHALWQGRFASDAAIVGKTLTTDRRAYTIVGVMPPGFGFPAQTSVWTPMESWYASQTDDRAIKRRDARFYSAIARIKPGISVRQAEEDLNRVAEDLERQYPADNRGIRVKLASLRNFETGTFRRYLLLLMAGVGLVVLVCCANVAALLLVRATGRQREITIQTALGAGRARIVRGLLTESLVLSVLGGLVGIGLAYGGVRGLVSLIPVTLPFWIVIEVDRTVLAFSLVVTMVTGTLFGLAPALYASRVDVNRVLKEGTRGSTSGRSIRRILVMGEVALSIVLLVCAALLLQTLNRLQTVRTGFVPEGLLTIRIVKYQAGTRQETAALLSATHARVLEAIRRVPGVVSASVTNGLPYTGTQTDRSRADISIRGRSREETKTLSPLAGADVGPDYFTTMRIPLVRGRMFDGTDTATSPKVVIINERAAKQVLGRSRSHRRRRAVGKPESIESVLPRRGHRGQRSASCGRRRQRHRTVLSAHAVAERDEFLRGQNRRGHRRDRSARPQGDRIDRPDRRRRPDQDDGAADG